MALFDFLKKKKLTTPPVIGLTGIPGQVALGNQGLQGPVPAPTHNSVTQSPVSIPPAGMQGPFSGSATGPNSAIPGLREHSSTPANVVNQFPAGMQGPTGTPLGSATGPNSAIPGLREHSSVPVLHLANHPVGMQGPFSGSATGPNSAVPGLREHTVGIQGPTGVQGPTVSGGTTTPVGGLNYSQNSVSGQYTSLKPATNTVANVSNASGEEKKVLIDKLNDGLASTQEWLANNKPPATTGYGSGVNTSTLAGIDAASSPKPVTTSESLVQRNIDAKLARMEGLDNQGDVSAVLTGAPANTTSGGSASSGTSTAEVTKVFGVPQTLRESERGDPIKVDPNAAAIYSSEKPQVVAPLVTPTPTTGGGGDAGTPGTLTQNSTVSLVEDDRAYKNSFILPEKDGVATTISASMWTDPNIKGNGRSIDNVSRGN